jgi:predicted RNA-binding Zn-ribbon protein involved in translation (DUF1610 family)
MKLNKELLELTNKIVEEIYKQKGSSRSNIKLFLNLLSTIAYTDGYLKGLEEKSNQQKNIQEKVISPISMESAEPIKPVHEEMITKQQKSFSDKLFNFNKQRLPNIPQEAYKVENGKKIIDTEKLKKIQDESKSYGFRCPNCLQSSIMITNKEKSEGLIRNIYKPMMMAYFNNLKETIKGYNDKISYSNVPLLLQHFYEKDYEEVFNFDEKDSPYLETNTRSFACCPCCGEPNFFDLWIEAWKTKGLYTNLEYICPLCGGEMRATNKATGPDEKNLSFSAYLSCDKCGFEFKNKKNSL